MPHKPDKSNDLIIVRGGGDIATGVVQKFFRAGFAVVILESPIPTAIRRSVALCEAVYDGVKRVEDVLCRSVRAIDALPGCWQAGEVPLLVDPQGISIGKLRPAAVIDAILAKHNLGTRLDMAEVTVALGPGFCAGKDVQLVIETMRGHDLGRLIREGSAAPDTGSPGEIGGQAEKRVLHAPAAGTVRHRKQIGDWVNCGEALLEVGGEVLPAPFSGLLRGLIREGMSVPSGMKIADIDPRADVDWRSISDKARCLGGAALEAYFYSRAFLRPATASPGP